MLAISDINYLSVLIATVASFAFGALWYSPLLFLKKWCRETGINPNESIDNPGKVYGLTFALTLISSLVIAVLIQDTPTLVNGLFTGLILGVGIAASSISINYQFANRGRVLLAIDAGFHVVRLTIIGLVQGLIG